MSTTIDGMTTWRDRDIRNGDLLAAIDYPDGDLLDILDTPPAAPAPAPMTTGYRAAYLRGWRASTRYTGRNDAAGSPLERADDRGEPAAWYDGYMDHACDREKFATPRGTGA